MTDTFHMPNVEDWVSITSILRSITDNHAVTISREAQRWRVQITDCQVWDEHLGVALIRCAAMAQATAA